MKENQFDLLRTKFDEYFLTLKGFALIKNDDLNKKIQAKRTIEDYKSDLLEFMNDIENSVFS